jgi:hypothetical protein
MKYLIALMLLLPMMCKAQGKFEGFWGIPFGDTRQEVIAKIKATKGLMPYKQDDDDVFYTDVTFGGEKDCILIFTFNKSDRLYSGFVLFQKDNIKDMLEGYFRFKDKLKEKYGEPEIENEVWPSFIQLNEYTLMEYALDKKEAKFISLFNATDVNGRDIELFLSLSKGEKTNLSMSVYDKKANDAIRKDKKDKEDKDF